jgi:hypothetical protein
MRRLTVGCVALLAALLMMAGSASAEATTTICIPTKAGKPIVSGEAGVCKNTKTVTYSPLDLPGQGGLETLNKILPHMAYVESGIAGKPTIQFSGVNVQVISGSGSTKGTVNGTGNVVIGYDENPGQHAQTGSHDLILGEEQTFTSFGGILAGRAGTISGPFASVTGGLDNVASGEGSWAGGGQHNVASGLGSSISGGQLNEAGFIGSVSGGAQNRASRGSSWVGGGKENNAAAEFTSIFGGKGLKAEKEFEAIP